MRAAVLLLAWAASAAASAWTDTQALVGTGAAVNPSSYHGPGLVYRGEVWNGDKTVKLSTESYVAKSVITGKDSYYPASLPETLKTPFVVPDSTHPKLAFWCGPAAAAAAAAAAARARWWGPSTRRLTRALPAPPSPAGTPRTCLSATVWPTARAWPSGKTWRRSATRGSWRPSTRPRTAPTC